MFLGVRIDIHKGGTLLRVKMLHGMIDIFDLLREQIIIIRREISKDAHLISFRRQVDDSALFGLR